MRNKDPVLDLLRSHLSIINVGIEKLVEHLYHLDIEVVQVDWRPPGGGKMEILKKMKDLMK